MVRGAACAAAAVLVLGCGAKPAPKPAPVSVLLVTVDTLRADRVGAYGDAQAKTPRIDALARDGVAFDAAFSAAPVTLPSHATLLTGLLPPVHGVRGNGTFALGPGRRTLAEAMAAEGRRCGAFVGAFPLARRFGLDRGFELYDDPFERAPGLHFDFAERPADRVVAAARAWLHETPGPVFAWVHVYDPHAPYAPPEAFRGPDPYRGEIAFVDASLGPLLDDWRGRPGPSIVALSSDHGEAFGEHGETSHSLFVYDTTLRVPLVLAGEGVPRGRRVAPPVSLADVAATLADLAGLRAGALPGTSLRAAWGESPPVARPVYAETLAPRLDFGWSDLRAWRDGRYKYVRAPRPELYDVAADPGETRDLAAAEPEKARALAGALEAALRASGDAESARAEADPEAAERLRALGYVQGPGGRGSGADPKDKVEVAGKIAAATGPFESPAALVAVYRDLARLDPENPVVNVRLADALLRSGDAAGSIPYFRRVVDGGARSADPYVGLATAYAQQGRLDDARGVLERALAADPSSGQAHFNLGEIARRRGETAEARAHYEAALHDPTTRERAQARLSEAAR